MPVKHISAVTFAVGDMARSVRFYESCGFELAYGGTDAEFTTLKAGRAFVNLIGRPDHVGRWWGRAIFRVTDVDDVYRTVCDAGLSPEAPPTDAAWGERYFHVADPDGHELSFAELI